jgi:hypothetical protein
MDHGAGDGIRTREYQLGRLMPYHLATPAIMPDIILLIRLNDVIFNFFLVSYGPSRFSSSFV